MKYCIKFNNFRDGGRDSETENEELIISGSKWNTV